jgi:High potential iron-sulfur protein
MNAKQPPFSRREAMARGAQAMVQAAVVSMVIVPLQVRAKAAKADFNYQERSKDGKTCATCRLFVATDSGKGACAVVEGEISPTGWCMAYSTRG